jgi:hypothetical protein
VRARSRGEREAARTRSAGGHGREECGVHLEVAVVEHAHVRPARVSAARVYVIRKYIRRDDRESCEDESGASEHLHGRDGAGITECMRNAEEMLTQSLGRVAFICTTLRGVRTPRVVLCSPTPSRDGLRPGDARNCMASAASAESGAKSPDWHDGLNRPWSGKQRRA